MEFKIDFLWSTMLSQRYNDAIEPQNPALSLITKMSGVVAGGIGFGSDYAADIICLWADTRDCPV